MNIITNGGSGDDEWTKEFRKRGSGVVLIPLESLIERLRGSLDQNLLADAVVVFAIPDLYVGLPGITLLSIAIKVSEELRALPDCCAMTDGRKWKSIPFIVLIPHYFLLDDVPVESLRGTLLNHSGPEDAFLKVSEIVSEYRRKLLDQLDNLGFLVSYENGRYRVGPALQARQKLESDLYCGAADKRTDIRGQYFTVDRDLYGIQYEIEQFEALINRPDVTEPDLQKFLEEHPYFLTVAGLMQPIPHVRLPSEKGKVLIPDFVLRPIVASQRDSNWEVLDLKRPQAKLLTGKAARIAFSETVMRAITQLRDYGDYFRDPSNSTKVASVLGHPLRFPKLAVLIGRLRQLGEAEALELAQAREPDVRIVTYDEILETQKRLLTTG
jgi:hypothetical protein